MTGRGRLAKVMFALMAAMTAGALLLLTLEGKPISWGWGYSLVTHAELNSVDTVLKTELGIDNARWRQLEISYRRCQRQLAPPRELTGSLAMAYHFVLCDGVTGPDGLIIPTPRWRRQLACLNHNNAADASQTIKICLIGDPSHPQRTADQHLQIEALVKRLESYCPNLQIIQP